MVPKYNSGDYILVTSLINAKANDIVVCRIERIGLVLKRIKYIDEFTMVLTGDNPRQDSSICGVNLNPNIIVGRVILHFPILRLFSYLSSKNKGFNI